MSKNIITAATIAKNINKVISVLDSTEDADLRAVREYMTDLADDILTNCPDEEIKCLEDLKELLLNGARDWKQFSDGGSSLCYTKDILERFGCTWDDLTDEKDGDYWMLKQARALQRAYINIITIYNMTVSW